MFNKKPIEVHASKINIERFQSNMIEIKPILTSISYMWTSITMNMSTGLNTEMVNVKQRSSIHLKKKNQALHNQCLRRHVGYY